MVHCAECYGKINEKDHENIFHITYGNMKNGNFYGIRTVYYHKKCLNTNNSYKRKIILESA